MSYVTVAKESMPSFRTGNGTIGTTAAALPGYPIYKHAIVRAASDNDSTISVGHSAAGAASGFVLAAGEQVTIHVDDLNKVYVVGGDADQNYSWIAV